VINKLIKLSNHLDECGLRKEADYLDVVIRKMAGRKKIKCRWCEWETPMWTRRKGGKSKGPESAWSRMFDHVYGEHKKELQGVISDSGASEELFGGHFAPELSAEERREQRHAASGEGWTPEDRPDLLDTWALLGE
jgi:hypothetical protein